MKTTLHILLACYVGISHSQSIVQNWSFEDTIPCFNNPNIGGPESAPPWFNPKAGSPDYYNYYLPINCGGGGVPFGFQYARTGGALVGIGTFGGLPNYREYIEGILSDSLKTNHKYCVSFYVSLPNNMKYASDAIGAYFTIDSLTDYNSNQVFPYIPHIESPLGIAITDTMNWVQISGEYIAQGGEKFITIGSFRNDSSTFLDTVNYGNLNFAYYYIDDIYVTDCTVGIEETMQQEEVLLSPSLAQEYVTIEYKPLASNPCRLEIFSSMGSRVMELILPKGSNKHRLTLSQLPPGVYYVRLQWSKQTAVGRFVKQ